MYLVCCRISMLQLILCALYASKALYVVHISDTFKHLFLTLWTMSDDKVYGCRFISAIYGFLASVSLYMYSWPHGQLLNLQKAMAEPSWYLHQQCRKLFAMVL